MKFKSIVFTAILGIVATCLAGPFQTCVVSSQEVKSPDCSNLVPCENTTCRRVKRDWADCKFNLFDSCSLSMQSRLSEYQILPCHYGIVPGDCRCNPWGDNPSETGIIEFETRVCDA
jgi:hypothetical protein